MTASPPKVPTGPPSARSRPRSCSRRPWSRAPGCPPSRAAPLLACRAGPASPRPAVAPARGRAGQMRRVRHPPRTRHCWASPAAVCKATPCAAHPARTPGPASPRPAVAPIRGRARQIKRVRLLPGLVTVGPARKRYARQPLFRRSTPRSRRRPTKCDMGRRSLQQKQSLLQRLFYAGRLRVRAVGGSRRRPPLISRYFRSRPAVRRMSPRRRSVVRRSHTPPPPAERHQQPKRPTAGY